MWWCMARGGGCGDRFCQRVGWAPAVSPRARPRIRSGAGFFASGVPKGAGRAISGVRGEVGARHALSFAQMSGAKDTLGWEERVRCTALIV